MSHLKLLAIAGGAAVLAACGASPDPSGDIEIVGNVKEIAVGDVVNLKWTSKNASRVYIAVSADGSEDIMLSEDGFSASGAREFQVDSTAFNFDNDDDVDLTFKLMARDADDVEMETLDKVSLEVEAITG